MKFVNVNKVLNNFGKKVVKESRSNLTRKKMGKGDLYNTLTYKIDQKGADTLFDFLMEPYGKFQDAGVFGAKPKMVKNGKQKGKSTDTIFEKYSYKNKKPPLAPMMSWAKSKNIRFRDAQGKFVKGNYRTIGFWLQKRIFAQGISPTLFFTKPFRRAYNALPDQLAEAYRLDIELNLKTNK
jgi:hypothetical protein